MVLSILGVDYESLDRSEQEYAVKQKNLKTFVYLGAAMLVIVAALFSSSGKKTPAQL
jgi:type IV secretion system protein TrbI